MRADRTPQAVVIAGPNGAGKTSSAPDLLQEAVGIDAFESTLAGRSAHRLLTGLVGVGYDVHIFYTLAALTRPGGGQGAPARGDGRSRRARAGHPAAVLEEPGELRRLYRPVTTTWRLYDGSALGGRPLIAHGTGASEPVVLNEATWLEIRKRIEEVA